MDKLSDRIVALRKQNKVTQDQLSKAIGISRTTLAHYEIGRRKPDYEILQRMADFFKVSTDMLLGREFNEEEKEVLTKIENAVPIDKIAKEHDISVHGKVLTNKQKKLFLSFIQMLVDNEKE